ncbi:MAG TPA: histidine phosphatase family protein [Verrucomicrobiae bacterium]
MTHPRPSPPAPPLSSPDLLHPTLLWLIRHAEVEPRYQSIFGGRIDMALSARGHEQAAALAAYVTRQPFAVLYASPMTRVQQTLAPMLNDGLKVTVLPELQEVDFGEWTGLSWEEVQKQFGISAFSWLEQLENNGIAKAEGAESLRQRLQPCLEGILQRHPGQQVAILCHGGVIRMLLAILLKRKFSAMAPFEIEYASITKVRWTPNRVRLELVNFAPWRDLPAAHAPRPA